METKLRYVPPAVSPERALRVFTEPERKSRNPPGPGSGARAAHQPQRRGAPRRYHPHAAHRQEGMAGRLAAARHHLHGPDHTQGDDTPTNVLRLCAKAKSPVRPDLLAALGATDIGITVGAVCVYHVFVRLAVEALQGSGIPVAAVSTGFPAGLNPPAPAHRGDQGVGRAGAQEIDVVITRAHALAGAWEALYHEVRAFREACGNAHMKVILGTGDLATLCERGARQPGRHDGRRRLHQDVHRQRSGERDPPRRRGHDAADPRLPRAHRLRRRVQAGGRDPQGQTSARLAHPDEGRAGRPLLAANLFRLGASALLTDIERQLEHFVTGRYSARTTIPWYDMTTVSEIFETMGVRACARER